MGFWRRGLRVAAALAVSTTPLLPQTLPTLRTETRVVQIDVEVKDSHGEPVAGLLRDDFTVTDSGKRRAIQIFSVARTDESPTTHPPAQVQAPNVFSNQSRTAQQTAHATVILLDGINNYWDDFAAARLRLLTMVDKLRTEERIAVYAATSQPASVAVVQAFTMDRELLRRTLKAYRPPVITPAPGMIAGPPTPPAEEEHRRRNAILDTMSAFRMLSEHMGKLPGRKSLLWLTSGLPPRQVREMPDPIEKATAALNEANIAVNVLDDDGVGDPHRRWGRDAFWTLRQLADRTGGKAYLGRNDLENMLTEAIEAPRITYTLGFYLPDEERDDKFHPLSVRVNRRGLNLSYRQGYYAGVAAPPTAPKKRQPLENALLDPQDSAEIPIAVEVTRLPNSVLRIAMNLNAAQLSFRQQDDAWSAKVEEMFLELNAAGQVLARVRDERTIKLSQRKREQFETQGIPLTQELKLMDGAVRLLIIVRDAESGRTGTLSVPLTETSR